MLVMRMLSLVALLCAAEALRLQPSRPRTRSTALPDFPSHPGYTGPETTPLLDQVSSPAAMKRFDIKQVRLESSF